MNVLRNGGKYSFFNNLDLSDRLVVKNYLFNFDSLGNCWLEDAEDFKTPEKLYDINSGMRKDIKKSFNFYNKNLGVLLTGNKGQGKSLNAKLLCKEIEVPIIIVNKSIPRNVDFVRFFNGIKQDYCFFVDEFEKLFDNRGEKDFHEQDIFLSFMDGVLTNEHKVLFLLTTNGDVNQYFINRPSRIKFLQNYNELPADLFNMILDDKLINKLHRSDLIDNVSLLNLNIDLLISIIDDINLFEKPFSEFKEIYNYKPVNYKYEIFVIDGGVEKYQGTRTSRRRVQATWGNILDLEVTEMISIGKDEFTFLSNDTEWDADDNRVETSNVYRVKLFDSSLVTSKAL